MSFPIPSAYGGSPVSNLKAEPRPVSALPASPAPLEDRLEMGSAQPALLQPVFGKTRPAPASSSLAGALASHDKTVKQLLISSLPPLQQPMLASTEIVMRPELYAQKSAEFPLLCQQTYMAASARLREIAEQNPERDAQGRVLLRYTDPESGQTKVRPAAVVLDLDDTVIDTSGWEGHALQEHEDFSWERWNQFCKIQAAEPEKHPPTPGSVAFINDAQQRGFDVYLVSNRRMEAKPATIAYLQAHGVEVPDFEERVIVSDEPRAQTDPTRVLTASEREHFAIGTDANEGRKAGRMTYVLQDHQLALRIGDQLSDLLQNIPKPEGANVRDQDVWQARRDAGQKHLDGLGKDFFVLPNARYGYWGFNRNPSTFQPEEKLADYNLTRGVNQQTLSPSGLAELVARREQPPIELFSDGR